MTTWRQHRVLRQFAALALTMCVFVISNNSSAQEDLADGADFNALLRARTKIELLAVGDPTDSTRKYANDFRNTYGVAIFLDRRIDPDVPLSLSLPEMRLELVLREIALRQKMSLVVRDGYLYIGPRTLCRWWPGELDALAKQVAKLPTATKQYWEAKSPLKWEEGAAPRDLAQKTAGSKLANAELDRIAHDIWAAFDGPTLPRYEQLAVICAGFDLIPEIGAAGEVTLVKIAPGKTQATQVTVPTAEVSEAMENIQRYMPDVKAAPKQGKLSIEGSFGENKTIQSWFTIPNPKRPAASKSRTAKPSGPLMLLTTPVPVPARQLLIKLAEQMKCELVIASDVAPEAVTKKIKPAWNGTREELLEKISKEIDLTCEFRDGRIHVSNP